MGDSIVYSALSFAGIIPNRSAVSLYNENVCAKSAREIYQSIAQAERDLVIELRHQADKDVAQKKISADEAIAYFKDAEKKVSEKFDGLVLKDRWDYRELKSSMKNLILKFIRT